MRCRIEKELWAEFHNEKEYQQLVDFRVFFFWSLILVASFLVVHSGLLDVIDLEAGGTLRWSLAIVRYAWSSFIYTGMMLHFTMHPLIYGGYCYP